MAKKRKTNPYKPLFFGVCLVLIGLLFTNKQAGTAKTSADPNTEKPEVTDLVISQTGSNLKSAQPDREQLIQLLQRDQVDVVIRLNADGDKLSIEEEADICKDYQVRFYYFNIEGNFDSTYQQIRNFLQDGFTLVHCLHGYDRAGAVMGRWLKDQGATDPEVIAFNQWENYLQNKGEAYRKYWDAAFKK